MSEHWNAPNFAVALIELPADFRSLKSRLTVKIDLYVGTDGPRGPTLCRISTFLQQNWTFSYGNDGIDWFFISSAVQNRTILLQIPATTIPAATRKQMNKQTNKFPTNERIIKSSKEKNLNRIEKKKKYKMFQTKKKKKKLHDASKILRIEKKKLRKKLRHQIR